MRHASVRVLARYGAGMVSGRQAVRIDGHLSSCARCSELSAKLDGVTTLLSLAEAPPMPARLTERIQAALATESAERAASAASRPGEAAKHAHAKGVVHTPGRPDLPERSRRRRLALRMPDLTSPRLVRGLAAVGAVLVLGSVGYVLATGARTSQSQPTAANPHPGPVAGTKFPHPPGSLRSSGVYVGLRPLSYRRNGQTTSVTGLTSTENFTPSNLAHEVRVQVANSEKMLAEPNATNGTQSGAAQTDNSFGGTTIPRLEACLSRIAAGRQVVLADVARYLGKPATIIVLRPLSADSAVFDIVVVALTCSASNSHIITQATVPTH
jgi:hypothetical protein